MRTRCLLVMSVAYASLTELVSSQLVQISMPSVTKSGHAGIICKIKAFSYIFIQSIKDNIHNTV